MIEKLLAEKHDKDLFVGECLMGQHGSRRLDAWVLKRTWSPLTTIGYEIKVSRSDFLRDDKWPAYLKACNQLYFVCPNGLIQPEELPDTVGLMWVSKNGTRLYTKRKAPRREITMPPDLLVHVLMCRSVIVGDMYQANDKAVDNRQRNVERWAKWLADKRNANVIGNSVKGEIRERWRRVNDENDRLRRRHKEYDEIRQRITELGLDPEQRVGVWEIGSKIDELRGAIPRWFPEHARRLAETCKKMADEVEKLRKDEVQDHG